MQTRRTRHQPRLPNPTRSHVTTMLVTRKQQTRRRSRTREDIISEVWTGFVCLLQLLSCI